MTYTVLARDPRGGLIGAATASRSLAVGNAVVAVDPRVGAVASQAWTNRALRGFLLERLRAGDVAVDAVGRIGEHDDRPELRQVAALPWEGEPAARTGTQTSGWAGHVVLSDAVVAGNLLTDAEVLAAMATELSSPPAEPDAVDYARHLVAVLARGEQAGGDLRGRQSAAVLVARAGGDVVVDLRVDDHPDPVAELARLVDLRASDAADLSSPGALPPPR
ncbi:MULTISPECIES: DUF1028 domain-containing protein [Microbacterium]|uniref:DUF1028 domain-containing protein n=1 Tax=Microbacterium wangchenii TaxID=2541726 RepID=A0ABX5SNS1_9MICO|nr:MULTISPECIES: DUF1028 domain-containing protein [Microbacterium]MCK6068112.1 DUF1028 domain-containing protein [Microbacterium sp. EYE_512]QBR87766.1 DUF1028 domain-containing protein [Microbacterium wangchenii]